MPVVAAVDQSEQSEAVVEQAGELAERYGVGLHVVHVREFSVGSFSVDDFKGTERDSPDMADVREEATRTAVEAAGRVDGFDELETVGLLGDPAKELVKYGRKHDAEYLVLGGRRRTPVGKVMFGSVTQSVLLSADRPIVVVMDATDRE